MRRRRLRSRTRAWRTQPTCGRSSGHASAWYVCDSLPAHAQAETAFTHACLADTADLREQLYQEMRGAIQEADQTAPLRCRSPHALLAWLHVALGCCTHAVNGAAQEARPTALLQSLSPMLGLPPGSLAG